MFSEKFAEQGNWISPKPFQTKNVNFELHSAHLRKMATIFTNHKEPYLWRLPKRTIYFISSGKPSLEKSRLLNSKNHCAHFPQVCTCCAILQILHNIVNLDHFALFTQFCPFCTILQILLIFAHFLQHCTFCTTLHILHNFAQLCTFCTTLHIFHNFAHFAQFCTPCTFCTNLHN